MKDNPFGIKEVFAYFSYEQMRLCNDYDSLLYSPMCMDRSFMSSLEDELLRRSHTYKDNKIGFVFSREDYTHDKKIYAVVFYDDRCSILTFHRSHIPGNIYIKGKLATHEDLGL